MDDFDDVLSDEEWNDGDDEDEMTEEEWEEERKSIIDSMYPDGYDEDSDGSIFDYDD